MPKRSNPKRPGHGLPILEAEGLNVLYGTKRAIKDMTLSFPKHHITALIGPSGCGKSTLLRSFNRMNEFSPGVTMTGKVIYKKTDLHAPTTDPVEVRRHIGMVFQKPNPFPKSIYDNIAWAPSLEGNVKDMDARVQSALEHAALWNEVKDRLQDSALGLSGGQQQRLCIARTLAMEPDVLLMDEPCSALDPVSTARIEELILRLKEDYTIVLVTHNMQQAKRVSDYTAFLEGGKLVEFGTTKQIFTKPGLKRTKEYVTGRFG